MDTVGRVAALLQQVADAQEVEGQMRWSRVLSQNLAAITTCKCWLDHCAAPGLSAGALSCTLGPASASRWPDFVCKQARAVLPRVHALLGCNSVARAGLARAVAEPAQVDCPYHQGYMLPSSFQPCLALRL